MDDLTTLSAAFVAQLYIVTREMKPEITDFEVDGVAMRILVSALDNYKQNEQSKKSSIEEGTAGTLGEPEQVQGIGGDRGTEESSQGILDQQSSTTKSGAKKRRSKKA